MLKRPFTSNSLQLYSMPLFDQENKVSFKQQIFKIYVKSHFDLLLHVSVFRHDHHQGAFIRA